MTSSQVAVLANVEEGLVEVAEFQRIAARAGVKLGPAMKFAYADEALKFMKAQPKGTRFAVGYSTSLDNAHVIVAHRGRFGVTHKDYQSNQVLPRFGLPKNADYFGDIYIWVKGG